MSFQGDLEEFIRRFNSRMEAIGRDVVINVGRSVVQKSPVDTGRFRANWQHGFTSPAVGVLDVMDRSGANSMTGITAGATANPIGVHFISNNLPYAQALENGSSQQAPLGIVGITAVEFKDIFNVAVRRAFR